MYISLVIQGVFLSFKSGGSTPATTTTAHGFMSTVSTLVKSPMISKESHGQDPAPLEDDNYLSSEYSETDDEASSEKTPGDEAQDRSQGAMVHIVDSKPSANAEELRFTLLTNQLLRLREHYVNVER